MLQIFHMSQARNRLWRVANLGQDLNIGSCRGADGNELSEGVTQGRVGSADQLIGVRSRLR
jgi:hypothetical protein